MIKIRDASMDDAGEILRIYDYYVTNTAISFEYVTPTYEEFTGRMRKTMERFPYLVAEDNGRVSGYAYAGPFHERAAYDRCCELTIYLDRDEEKQGIGRLLYEALEERLLKMGMLNLYACIAYPEHEDEYLTANSAGFHAHLGFRVVGTFYRCGWKFGRWYDMVWMEKLIGEREPGTGVDPFMSAAIREAEEGIRAGHGGPFGCVIEKDGAVIGSGHNEVIKNNDPTCHGEVMAIRAACKKLGTFDLSGCRLYTTAQPCPMCLGAIQWANISKVYYGCNTVDTDRIGFRDKVFYENAGVPAEEMDREACLKVFEEYGSTGREKY